jgi:succinate dehydrogenase / fumarate reductase iron-sulfur subunit
MRVRLKVHRQDAETAESYIHEFEIPLAPNMNVISALMEVRKAPTTASGEEPKEGEGVGPDRRLL